MIRTDEEFARKLQADLDKEYSTSAACQTAHNSTHITVKTSTLSSTSNPFVNAPMASSASRRRLNDHSDSLQNAYRILNRSSDQLNSLRATNVRSETVYGMHPSIEQDMLNLMARNISSNELSSTSRNRATAMPVRLSQMGAQRHGRHHLPGQQEHRNRLEHVANHNNIFLEPFRAARQHEFQNLRSIQQQNQRLFRQNLLFDNDPNTYEVFF